jgi:DNA-binding XRE family transcriptional regulator
MFVSAEVEASFWRRVDRTPGYGPQGDCWVMSKPIDPARYGKFTYTDETGKRQMDAHRFSLALSLGRLPNGDSRHTCHFRPCCRPDHLIEGTRRENMADAVQAGRTLRGERNPLSKLTAAEVAEIKALRRNGIGQRQVAKKFGIAKTTVQHIDKGRLWKHVS